MSLIINLKNINIFVNMSCLTSQPCGGIHRIGQYTISWLVIKTWKRRDPKLMLFDFTLYNVYLLMGTMLINEKDH